MTRDHGGAVMAEKDIVVETEEKEPVSKKLIRIWQKGFMIMSRHVSRRNQMAICISDMPSLFF